MLSWFSECGCFSSNLPAIYLGIQSKTVLSHWFSKSKSKKPESRYGSLMTWKFWKDYLQTKTTAPSFSKNEYVEWEIKLKTINEGCPVTILFYFLFGDMRSFFFLFKLSMLNLLVLPLTKPPLITTFYLILDTWHIHMLFFFPPHPRVHKSFSTF